MFLARSVLLNGALLQLNRLINLLLLKSPSRDQIFRRKSYQIRTVSFPVSITYHLIFIHGILQQQKTSLSGSVYKRLLDMYQVLEMKNSAFSQDIISIQLDIPVRISPHCIIAFLKSSTTIIYTHPDLTRINHGHFIYDKTF